ncbi:short-chain dehydrogenase [Rhodococcoides trifolii]|uniref:Short-chain dehydrogenase n=1 Tax=Rhodococcoides trifolii TaxID=908250 RepID=A0A917G7S8_9NOCA|nr:SDR family oxidoreductase [Rhodococcus trifolii]GGG27193.1 short-chain dehydrogenase [Rhodococcus trifolii]
MSTVLAGKVALVTGASRGLGAAIAAALAEDGADVLVHFASDHDAARAVVLDLRSRGVKAAPVRADLTEPTGPQLLWEEVDHALAMLDLESTIDIIVNNAGVNVRASIDDVEPADFDRQVALNQRAPVFVTQMGLSRLRDGGRIINISSGSARYARPGVLAYAMTKGALNVFTRALAAHLGDRRITVNAVAPSALDTDMNASWLRGSADARSRFAETSASGALSTPADIAAVVRFLASPASQSITGQTIDVTGGNSL